jgi:acetyl esterase/lipase
MRYLLAVIAVGALAVCAAPAQNQPCAVAGNDNSFLGIQTIRLWPGDAPGAKGKACEDTPTLTIVSPRAHAENGTAVIINPGGSYKILAGDLEGGEIANWFAARGVRAFVLSYRLTTNGYMMPAPLEDARRAVQFVRAHAAEYKVNPNRIGLIGFSAGGHLAALAGTRPIAGKADASDPVERVSSRPDYLVLGYPWLGAIGMDMLHLNYCKINNVVDQCEALRAAYSPDLFVSKDTPPVFLYHTFNDKTVPVEQALTFYNALVKNGVSAEMHIFANGGHGSGLGKGDAALDQWPALLETWMREQGLLTVDKEAVGAK